MSYKLGKRGRLTYSEKHNLLKSHTRIKSNPLFLSNVEINENYLEFTLESFVQKVYALYENYNASIYQLFNESRIEAPRICFQEELGSWNSLTSSNKSYFLNLNNPSIAILN